MSSTRDALPVPFDGHRTMTMPPCSEHTHLNTPDSSPDSSDSEGHLSDTDTLLRSASEPDVSLDEMLSLACRQGKLDIVEILLQSGAQINHRNKAGNTPLLEACSQGHVMVANYLLENGSKIDTPTETTLDSALTWACTLGNTNIVNALLYKKADVEHRTKDGCTALMFACLAGHREVAQKLLDANSEINVESASNKDSPLTFACWKGHFDVVELLLKRKANMEHRTKEGFSPLMFAALGGHTRVARKLLEHNAQVNVPSGSNNDIPLTSACWKGHTDVVQLLLEFQSNIEHRTKDGCTPLMLAAREGHLPVAKLLLETNAYVNVPSGSENNIPLTLACWKGHLEVVHLLLDHRSDIEHRNKAGCTPLMLAAREGHLETTSLLLSRKAEVNIPSGSNDDTPLTLACWKGHRDVVILLLEHKSNVDHQTKTGCTPLMEATREGHRDVANVLLNHNADVELPDNYGQSPLFMACWKGHHSVAELLLSRGAYRDCRTKTGITPLFQACRENHVSIVELLLGYGAGVNSPFPNSRENPMTLCAEKGHKQLVELLLAKGASQDCRTKKGCTPAFLACKEGHIEIARLLKENTANLETADCRGNTPIVTAFKAGHVEVVEWLIEFVQHLPSDELCHKVLMSAVEEKDKDVIVQKRSKCLAIIQETKKKREQLALKNAQNLVQELDEERSREEKKKKKLAAKRRDKRNKRKKKSEEVQANGEHCDGEEEEIEEEENDEEEVKDNAMPTENRDNTPEEECLPVINPPSSPLVIRQLSKKTDRQKKTKQQKLNNSKKALKLSQKEMETNDVKNAGRENHSNKTPIDVKKLADELSGFSLKKTMDRQLPKTSGVCTQSTSTLGPSRTNLPIHQTTSSRRKSSSNSLPPSTPKPLQRVVVTSLATSTTATLTTTYATDPRTQSCNITPKNDDGGGWVTATSSANIVAVENDNHKESSDSGSVSRTSSFDEYRESDWREISRTHKLLVVELTVPNGYCGRVIGKGGKKINHITEESGSQITIDKPSQNVMPADRIISIKGSVQNVDKARSLVTKALNTPSLAVKGDVMAVQNGGQQGDTKSIPPLLPPDSVEVARPKPPSRVTESITVTPGVSYSRVAKKEVWNCANVAQPTENFAQLTTTTNNPLGKSKSTSSAPSPSPPQLKETVAPVEPRVETPVPTPVRITSCELLQHPSGPTAAVETSSPKQAFASKEFSYFSMGSQSDPPEEPKGSPQSSSHSIDKQEEGEIDFDRNRSVSWTTGQSELAPNTSRSLSTDAINIPQQQQPWSKESSEVFSDDVAWQGHTKDWEQESSPRSSVSSSKVELNSILDNPPPLVVNTDPKVFENTPWLQNRGAFSAPSSPSVLRGAEGNARGDPPAKSAIRSHTSVEELNTTWLEKKDQQQQHSNQQQQQLQQKSNPPNHSLTAASHSKTPPLDEAPPLLSTKPPQQPITKSASQQQHLRAPQPPPMTSSRAPPQNAHPPLPSATPWSAQRFQNTRNLADLMSHLSLDKYTNKFLEHGVTLEVLVTLNEKDLESFGIPKGPRLKILKASEVIRGQRYPANNTCTAPLLNSMSSSYPVVNHHPPSQHVVAPAFEKHQQPPSHQQQYHPFQRFPPAPSQQQQEKPFINGGAFAYPDFLQYRGPTLSQQPQQQQTQHTGEYNVLMPPVNQPFLHPAFPPPRDEFTPGHHMSGMQEMVAPPPQPAYPNIFPEQAFYFYPS